MDTRRPNCSHQEISYDTEGWHTWTEDEIDQYEKFWPRGTMQRTAFDLLLYTGQRSADVRQMKPVAITPYGVNVVAEFVDGVDVKQQKTKSFLTVPITDEIKKSLSTIQPDANFLVETSFGNPFTEKGFSNYISKAATKAGLPHCSAHGLRKSASTRLADAGCTEAEIMAITGHKTSREVSRYTRAANQRKLAQQAMQKMEQDRKRRLG